MSLVERIRRVKYIMTHLNNEKTPNEYKEHKMQFCFKLKGIYCA